MVVSMTKKMKIKLLFYCICFMNDLDGYVAIPDVHDDDDADDNAFFFTSRVNFFITSCCSSSSATIGAALSTTW